LKIAKLEKGLLRLRGLLFRRKEKMQVLLLLLVVQSLLSPFLFSLAFNTQKKGKIVVVD
jgi:hypothetical protein